MNIGARGRFLVTLLALVLLGAWSFTDGSGAAHSEPSSRAAANPVSAAPVPQNPYLAANGRGFVHDDAYQSDTYTWDGPLSPPTVIRSFFPGGKCMPPLVDSADRLVTICKEPEGPRLVLLDPATMQPLASAPLPGDTNGKLPTSYGYGYLDPQDRLVVGTPLRKIWIIEETDSAGVPGFGLVQALDLRSYLASTDRLFSLMPDWQGRIWFVTTAGVVGWVDPEGGGPMLLSLSEPVANSLAIDETGGVYVVTDYALYRIDPDAETGAPTVTWRETYDRGTRIKPGQGSQGSGTSPTLMGTDFVSIADNADPQVHALVFRRGRDVSEARLVCSVPLFMRRKGASENSFMGTDRSLIIENNYGYRSPNSMVGGRATAPGVARVDVVPGGSGCSTVWVSAERVPASAGKLSLSNGLVYLWTKDPDPNGIDAWKFTAVDFETGVTTYDVEAGIGTNFDSNYGAITITPDGKAYATVVAGLVQPGVEP